MKTISRYIMTLALLITAVTGAMAQTPELLVTIESKGNGTSSQTFDGKAILTFGGGKVSNDNDNWGWYNFSGGEEISLTVTGADGYTVTSCTFYTNSSSKTVEGEHPTVYVTGGPSQTYTATGKGGNSLGAFGVTKIEVYGYAASASSAIEVTTDKAENETTFTEASFEMPASDVTAEYELVRDMSVQMTATMGDGTDGVRYRVKKDGNKFIPADMEMAAVPALFTVNDAIEQKALTQTQDYIVQIYAIDAEGQPTGEAMTFATFTFEPGIYAVKAVAADGSDYAGETALSNTFKLFQGYEVTVAAKEFITYYKDEPLRVEDEAAELYTIQSVNGDQAVLSDRSDAMPSNTPMLVYNKSNETKVILLIPCAEPDMAITVAPEFQGTLTATTIAASTDAQTNYALNGKQFVFVKNAIEIGPNKAWLSIPSGMTAGARALNIVFSDATGINGVSGVKEVNDGSWYDLNGRKLNGMPTKKGVYIMNGKKVVVR